MLLQIYFPQIKKYFYILKSFKLYKFHGGVPPIQAEGGAKSSIPHLNLLYTKFLITHLNLLHITNHSPHLQLQKMFIYL